MFFMVELALCASLQFLPSVAWLPPILAASNLKITVVVSDSSILFLILMKISPVFYYYLLFINMRNCFLSYFRFSKRLKDVAQGFG